MTCGYDLYGAIRILVWLLKWAPNLGLLIFCVLVSKIFLLEWFWDMLRDFAGLLGVLKIYIGFV